MDSSQSLQGFLRQSGVPYSRHEDQERTPNEADESSLYKDKESPTLSKSTLYPSYTPFSFPPLQRQISPGGAPSSPAVSPRVSPRYGFPPSSPRVDVIPSVSQRVDSWRNTGFLAQLLANAQINAEVDTKHARKLPSYNANEGTHSYAKTPSSRAALLAVDKHLRRRHVFQVLDTDMIIKGIVYNKIDSGLVITIHEAYPTPGLKMSFQPNLQLSSVSSSLQHKRKPLEGIEDLSIHGVCHFSEMQRDTTLGKSSEIDQSTTSYDKNAADRFSLGDFVKALVISVDVHSEKVYLSLNNDRLRGITTPHRLGLCDSKSDEAETILSPRTDDEPTGFFTSPYGPVEKGKKTNSTSSGVSSSFIDLSDEKGSTSSLSYEYGSHNQYLPYRSEKYQPRKPKQPAKGRSREWLTNLRDQPIFKNPEGLNIMLEAYKICEHGSLLRRPKSQPNDFYNQLRHDQNQVWAKESVEKGVALAKQGQIEDALKCYQHALEVDSNYLDAVVAKGAAYVMQNKMEAAVTEFENALTIDPHCSYAHNYLEKAREKIKQTKKEQTRRTPTPTTPILTPNLRDGIARSIITSEKRKARSKLNFWAEQNFIQDQEETDNSRSGLNLHKLVDEREILIQPSTDTSTKKHKPKKLKKEKKKKRKKEKKKKHSHKKKKEKRKKRDKDEDGSGKEKEMKTEGKTSVRSSPSSSPSPSPSSSRDRTSGTESAGGEDWSSQTT